MPEFPHAPEIALPDLSGKIHRLPEYRGRLVIVTFWATWCPQCVYEMPDLARFWRKYKNRGVVLLAIDVDEPRAAVQRFVTDHRLDFPILLDSKMDAYKRWPVLGLPATYLVDGRGRLRYEAVGAVEWQDRRVIELIEGLLP